MRVPTETSVRAVEGADGGFRAGLVPTETSIRAQAGVAAATMPAASSPNCARILSAGA